MSFPKSTEEEDWRRQVNHVKSQNEILRLMYVEMH